MLSLRLWKSLCYVDFPYERAREKDRIFERTNQGNRKGGHTREAILIVDKLMPLVYDSVHMTPSERHLTTKVEDTVLEYWKNHQDEHGKPPSTAQAAR